jgi:hypothetical protein
MDRGESLKARLAEKLLASQKVKIEYKTEKAYLQTYFSTG